MNTAAKLSAYGAALALLIGNLAEAARRVIAGRRRKSSARPATEAATRAMVAG